MCVNLVHKLHSAYAFVYVCVCGGVVACMWCVMCGGVCGMMCAWCDVCVCG